MLPSARRIAERHEAARPTARELAAKKRAAEKAWTDHFLATGEWDPALERAYIKAERAYIKAQDDDENEESDDDE